jgi:hypothetical protein
LTVWRTGSAGREAPLRSPPGLRPRQRDLETTGRHQPRKRYGRRDIDEASIKESTAAQRSMPIEVAYRSFGAEVDEALLVRPGKAVAAPLAVLCEGRDQRGLVRPGAA